MAVVSHIDRLSLSKNREGEREFSLSMASRLPIAMERSGLVGKPYAGVMNSVFVSAAKAASKMLVTAASGTMADGAGGGGADRSWGPIELVRYFVMVTIYANVWVLRLLTDAFPPSSSLSSANSGDLSVLDYGIDGLVVKKGSSTISSSSSSSSALVVHGGLGNGIRRHPSSTAIGRALSHILGLLNDVPATSRNYEYVLGTAERILNENAQSGHAALLDVNRVALSAAFSRTCDLLRRSLRRSEASTAPWPDRLLRMVPMGDRLAAACRDSLRPFLGRLLLSSSSSAEEWKPSSSLWPSNNKLVQRQQLVLAAKGPAVSSSEWLESEKLANELLWITKKLRACSAAGEGIVRWGFASALASLSLTAHPRIQGPLVKITVMLYRDLVRGEWEAAREVRFGILALWLPLLCFANTVVTSPVLTGTEKWETEKVVEELIVGLPWDDQEIILRNWLEDFAASDSDWPNLQRCFDWWCRQSRNLLL